MAEINALVTEEKLFISLMINLYDKFSDVLEVSDILSDQSLENAHNAYPEATPLIHSGREFAHIIEAYKTKLDEYEMSRVSKCIDNGVCEGFQGKFNDMLFILYLNMASKDEIREVIKGTLDYYINHYL